MKIDDFSLFFITFLTHRLKMIQIKLRKKSGYTQRDLEKKSGIMNSKAVRLQENLKRILLNALCLR